MRGDIFSEPSTRKLDDAEWSKIQSIGKEGSHDPIVWKNFIPTSRHSWEILPSSTRWRWPVGRNYTSLHRIFLFPSLPASQTIGSFSSRHNKRTDRRGSYCENSWWIWNGNCDSINFQTWRRNLRRDIQRNRALCDWNSHSRSKNKIQ